MDGKHFRLRLGGLPLGAGRREGAWRLEGRGGRQSLVQRLDVVVGCAFFPILATSPVKEVAGADVLVGGVDAARFSLRSVLLPHLCSAAAGVLR